MTTIDCAFFISDNGTDFDDTDRLFEQHLRTCRRCGRRVLDNATNGFRRALIAPSWRLFMPFAIAETMVTFAAATVIVPLGTELLLAAIAVAFFGPIAFVYVQRRCLESFFARRVVPLMRLRYFRTGVGNPRADGRHRVQQEAVLDYLRFSRSATRASFLAYVLVGSIFAYATSEVDVAALHIALGTCWAVLLRSLLSTVQLIDVLEVTDIERTWLHQVSYTASTFTRVLGPSDTLASVVRLHVIVIGALGGFALIAVSAVRGPFAAVAAGALGLGAVALYLGEQWASRRSERPAALRGDEFTLLRGS